MVDPFRAAAIRERITQAGGIALLIGLLLVLFYVSFRSDVDDGSSVEAEVVRVGIRTAASKMGGDLPILTVRLPDGSVRVVPASWGVVSNCAPGRRVSLLQRGTALQVGLRGCHRKH